MMIYFDLLIKLLALRRRLGSSPVFGWGSTGLVLVFSVVVFACLRPVSYVPNIVNFFGLPIRDCPSVFFNVHYPRHFLLKCLYQARKMFVCVRGIDFASF